MRRNGNLLEPQIKSSLHVWGLPSGKGPLHNQTPFSHFLYHGRKAVKRLGKPTVQHFLDYLNALVALIARLGTLFKPSIKGAHDCHVGHALDDAARIAHG